MGLQPIQTGSISITTTPVNITSSGYFYHHITVFVTSTVGSTDSYEIIVLEYDPIAATYARMDSDIINLSWVGGSLTPTLQNRIWKYTPSPGNGVRLTITKLAGNNGTANYQIVQAS